MSTPFSDALFVTVHRRWLLVILIALNLAAIGVVSISLKNRYDWENHDAEVRVQNVALAIDLHLSSEINKIDLSLNTVISEFGHHLKSENKTQRQVINTLLKNQKALLPETDDGWGVTDVAGRRIFNESDEDSYHFSVADRDYFLDLQSGRVDGLIVSEPLKSKRTGKNVVVLPARIETIGVNLQELSSLRCRFRISTRYWKALTLGHRELRSCATLI